MNNNNNNKPIQGLFLLVDRKSEPGMIRWIDGIEKRNMPALVLADGYTLNSNPQLIKNVFNKGLDVGAIYNDGPIWEETYDEMIAWIPNWMNIDKPHLLPEREVLKMIMEHLNDKMISLTGEPMRVFGGRYFSYDEDTVQIAEEMGVEYILARGTKEERAFFYQPKEYKPTIISVSNVPSKELGTGSLCDESLKNRKETPSEFRNVLFNIDVDKLILVAQTHISGVDDEWWEIYQEYFDKSRVEWLSLSDFIDNPQVLPYKDIPMNKQTAYMVLDLEKAKKSGTLGDY